MGICRLMGTEFPFCKNFGFDEILETIVQQCECTQCYRTVHLKIMKKVNFILPVFITI